MNLSNIKRTDEKEQGNGQKKFYYSKEMFFTDAQKLLKEIKKDHEREPYDLILGIARGGIPLATYLSKEIPLEPMISIQLKSYKGTTQKKLELVQEPDWISLKGKNVLVVEDLIDSGKTLTYLFELFKEHGISKYKLCVLIDKKKNPNIVPDYWARKIEEWIVFFWEANYYKPTRQSIAVSENYSGFKEIPPK